MFTIEIEDGMKHPKSIIYIYNSTKHFTCIYISHTNFKNVVLNPFHFATF